LRPKIFISIPTDRAKWYLDTAIFRDLASRFDIHIFGRLSRDQSIVNRYGQPNVHFEPELTATGKLHSLTYSLFDASRSLGYKYRHRHVPGMAIRLDFTIRYRQLSPPVSRTAWRRWVLWGLAWATANRPGWRLVKKLAARYATDQEFERLVEEHNPIAMIVFGVPSVQEVAFAASASRHRIKSIMVAISPDQSFDLGYLVGDYSVITAWGPWMRRSFEQLHDIAPERIADMGILTTRLQSEILSRADDGYIRSSLNIREDQTVVTYMSVVNYETADTFKAVDSLASAVEDGTLPDVVIVLRTTPWEDTGPALKRYQDNPYVRVQEGNKYALDAPGTSALKDHSTLLRASALMIMGSITSSVFATAVWGVPTVLNRAGRTADAEDVHPMEREDEDDPGGMVTSGLPVARSTDELIQLTQAHLNNPGMNEQVWKRIASDWDYQNDDYVADFRNLLSDSRTCD
jgi:hypothetical protein